MKPKQLIFQGVRFVTAEDLILVSDEGTITVVAAKVENGKTLSIVKETFIDGHLQFHDVALDEHGTIQAAIHLLRRCFRWEKIAQTARFNTPIWKLKAKRLEDFDLFVIAHWEGWNLTGVSWAERNYLAQTSDMSLGKMECDTFERRCRRLGLRYQER